MEHNSGSVYKRIIYVMKDELHMYPPCISHILMLRELGCQVYVVAEQCDEKVIQLIEQSGAQITILGNVNKLGGKIGKIKHWLEFGKSCVRHIKKIYNENDIIWLGSAGTAIALKRFVKTTPFIISVLELYDMFPFYRNGLSDILPNASAIVACEKNRARIMKQWYSLSKLPYVMPNKPFYETHCEKSDKVKAFVDSLQGKKIILYQGIFSKDRSIVTLAKALNNTKEHYTLVLIGKAVGLTEKQVEKQLREVYSDVVYGGYFPAPMHLYVTENANMAVAFYDDSSINNMFCAPNKIFEYSKYGIPMLASDIPGLQLTVEKYDAGICVDMSDSDKIAWAIDEISQNYNKYQQGSRGLYTSVDNTLVMKQLLNEIGVINNESIC